MGNTCPHGVKYGVKNPKTYRVDGRCEICSSLEFRKDQSEHWSNEDLFQRFHPLFKTDLSEGPVNAIEKIRALLDEARGQCSDMKHSYSGWGQQLQDVEGLLTCGLICLYRVLQEMQEVKDRQEKQARGDEISKVVVR